MRYSHSLRRYHRQSHTLLSILVTLLSILAISLLLLISHTNAIDFLKGLLLSTTRVSIAYVITLPLALAIVILATRSQTIEDFFVPILDVTQSFPSFAVLPLILAVAGKGTTSIVIFLMITMIWPILFTLLSGLKTARQDLAEAASVFQAKGLKRLVNFLLPAIFPALITGSIVGWGEAWEAIVGAELIAQSTGVGAFIGSAYDAGNRQIFTIAIISLMLFIFILNRLIWLPLLKKATTYQTE